LGNLLVANKNTVSILTDSFLLAEPAG